MTMKLLASAPEHEPCFCFLLLRNTGQVGRLAAWLKGILKAGEVERRGITKFERLIEGSAGDHCSETILPDWQCITNGVIEFEGEGFGPPAIAPPIRWETMLHPEILTPAWPVSVTFSSVDWLSNGEMACALGSKRGRFAHYR